MTWLKIGQTFTSDNADYSIDAEEWVIQEIYYPTVTFSNTRYWQVDIAGIYPSSGETVVGIIVSETDEVALITHSHSFTYEAGILLKGYRASYLKSLDPIIRY